MVQGSPEPVELSDDHGGDLPARGCGEHAIELGPAVLRARDAVVHELQGVGAAALGVRPKGVQLRLPSGRWSAVETRA